MLHFMPHPCACANICSAEPWSSLEKLVWRGDLLLCQDTLPSEEPSFFQRCQCLHKGSGHKLKCRMFPLYTRKHFCTVQEMERWHSLSREAVGSSEVFKSFLDTMQSTLLWVSLLDQGLEQKGPEVPSDLYRAVILWKYRWRNSSINCVLGKEMW